MSNQQDEGQVRLDVGGWISGPCLTRPLNVPYDMTGEEATALFHLRCIWGDRYGISFTNKQWKAHRLGTGAPWNITADTAEELRSRIGEDFRQWQIEARKAI
jgi:hypothetical protein